jgi:hypothetical protein
MHNTPDTDQDKDTTPAREDQSAHPDSAESSADVKAPFAPHKDDDSAFGDTDQHSTA